jgi:glycine/sarcosine N-methyltransferase
MKSGMFQDLTDVYEAMIDWPKRLANEGPFYRRWFERHAVRSVLDVACGAGRHAAMFHSWGLRVEGADLSPAMIDLAKNSFGEPAGLRWVVRGFDQAVAAAEPFDAAICVGNSLPLAPDTATVGRAVEQMLAAVRDGGLVVIQAMNLRRLADGQCLWQKCRRAALPRGEVLIVKGVHRCGRRGCVELIVAELNTSEAEPRPADVKMLTESTPLLGLDAAELESIVRAAGGEVIGVFGGYGDEPYDPAHSIDLVMVAEKKEKL